MPSMRCVGRIGRGDGNKKRPATSQSSRQNSSRSSSSHGRGVPNAFPFDALISLQARRSGRVLCKLPPATDKAYATDICGAQPMQPPVRRWGRIVAPEAETACRSDACVPAVRAGCWKDPWQGPWLPSNGGQPRTATCVPASLCSCAATGAARGLASA
jgi:hypothetical protein